MHVLLIALFAVAGPGESPFVTEQGLAAAPTEVFEAECEHRHCTRGCVHGRGCRFPRGLINGLRVAPPEYLLPCAGSCGYGPGYAGYYQPRYDYRRVFDYPWGVRPRARICPLPD